MDSLESFFLYKRTVKLAAMSNMQPTRGQFAVSRLQPSCHSAHCFCYQGLQVLTPISTASGSYSCSKGCGSGAGRSQAAYTTCLDKEGARLPTLHMLHIG